MMNVRMSNGVKDNMAGSEKMVFGRAPQEKSHQ